MTRKQITYQLGQQLLDTYCHILFGKVSKKEIDVMVFSVAVKCLFCDNSEFWEQDHSMRWLLLGGGELIKISTHLKLTKARVQTLVEQAYALERKQELTRQDVIDELLALLKRSKASDDLNAAGVIRLQVPNRATRIALEDFFVALGSIVDGSFNSDLLVLSTAEILAALTKHASNQQELIKQLVAVAEQHLPDDQGQSLREKGTFSSPQNSLNKIGDWPSRLLLKQQNAGQSPTVPTGMMSNWGL